MAKRSVDRVLEALGLAQPKMRARYGPNACVICTRIAVETFRKHGIRAQPLAVSATVYNPTMTRYWEANDSAGAEQDMHARSVVLGFSGNGPPGLWDGHAVCIVEGRTLVDLTLDQVNEFGHGFAVTPARLPIPPGFARGGTVSFTNHGCYVQYDAKPDEKAYLTLEDWSDALEREPLMRHVDVLLRGAA
jgi:hypothetical protein